MPKAKKAGCDYSPIYLNLNNNLHEKIDTHINNTLESAIAERDKKIALLTKQRDRSDVFSYKAKLNRDIKKLKSDKLTNVVTKREIIEEALEQFFNSTYTG